MPSNTDRLSLLRHTLADVFKVDDYGYNWGRLDEHPGIFICESSTRPTGWAERQTGMAIFETDTNLTWHWDGSAWERNLARGLIGFDSTTSEVSTALTTFQTAIPVIVDVASGGRYHQITVSAPGVKSTEDLTEVGIFRDATQLQAWFSQGGTGVGVTEAPRGLSHVFTDLPTPGSITYSLRYRAVSGVGGTSTIEAGANSPITIAVVEV